MQRVLQNLLDERISIRDLPRILEDVSEASGFSRNVAIITERVRARLARQISNARTNETGFDPIITLSPEWEQAFAEAIVGEGENRPLPMAPSKPRALIKSVHATFERYATMGEMPVLMTSPAVRPFVRSTVERFRPTTMIMSQNEVHPKAKIKTLGQVSPRGAQRLSEEDGRGPGRGTSPWRDTTRKSGGGRHPGAKVAASHPNDAAAGDGAPRTAPGPAGELLGGRSGDTPAVPGSPGLGTPLGSMTLEEAVLTLQ